MSDNLTKILEASKNYSKEFGKKSELSAPPLRKIAILTCMDARLHPSVFAGLKEGDAHVIRNAGGRASLDAIRSLVISNKMLGTNEWYVIHHTECGLGSFTNETMVDNYSKEDENSSLKDNQEALKAAKELDWLTFKDAAESVTDDVKTIRNHPLVPTDVVIYGLLYNVKTGRLEEIEEANIAGKPT